MYSFLNIRNDFANIKELGSLKILKNIFGIAREHEQRNVILNSL